MFNMAVPLVDRHVHEGRGSRPALRMDGSTISYANLLALVNRAGNALRATGVMPEPINTAAREAELRFVLDDSRARALVAHASLVDRVVERPAVLLVVGGAN